MKKLFVPALLLLSLTGLVACGSDNSGFVKNGVAYKNGDAAKVSTEVREAKENKIKTVTEKVTLDIYVKASANGQSSSLKETASATLTVDIDARTIEGKFDISATIDGTKESAKIDFKAVEQDGVFVFTRGAESATMIGEDQLSTYYNNATVSIYSWNYVTESNDAASLVNQSGTSSISEQDALTLVNKITSNTVISGDVATGTFEVGLGKPLDVTVSDYPFTFNKLKAVYEEGLLKSSVIGLSMNYKQTVGGQTAKITLKESANYSFSYTFKN